MCNCFYSPFTEMMRLEPEPAPAPLISPRCHSIAWCFWTRGCCYPLRFPSTFHPNFESPNPVRHSTNAPFTAFSNPKLTLPWSAIQEQSPVFEYCSTTTLEASISTCSCYAIFKNSRNPTYIVPLFHPPALQEMDLRRLAINFSLLSRRPSDRPTTGQHVTIRNHDDVVIRPAAWLSCSSKHT
jgi:hypothetical protein